MNRSIYFSRYFFQSWLVFALLYSCTSKHERLPEKVIEKTEPVDLQVTRLLKAEFDQYAIDSILEIDGDTLHTSGWIFREFRGNDFNPPWTKDTILLPAVDSLLAFIDSSERSGLIPGDYRADRLRSKIRLIADTVQGKINVTRICELNLLLSDAFFRIATHLSKGRLDPDSLTRTWKGDPSDTLIAGILSQAIRKNHIRESLAAFEPKFEQYALLKRHLYDPDTGQMSRIVVNLERWRWEKTYYEDYYLIVNIPEFMLRYYECDTLKLTSRIIAGKPETPSPYRLNSKIVYFYVYPYWQVPLSIATKEILPALKKDTSYFTKHNMDLLDAYGNPIDRTNIDWKKYSEKYFPFKLRQRDGDENTLGVLKFIFPNKFDIYLHDTNAPHLFKKEKRALSHGCIRVERARQFAKKLLGCCALNFPADSLNLALKNKERKKVTLYNRVQVHIRYFTCVADSAGVKFFDDVYGLDQKIQDNLLEKESMK